MSLTVSEDKSCISVEKIRNAMDDKSDMSLTDSLDKSRISKDIFSNTVLDKSFITDVLSVFSCVKSSVILLIPFLPMYL